MKIGMLIFGHILSSPPPKEKTPSEAAGRRIETLFPSLTCVSRPDDAGPGKAAEAVEIEENPAPR